MADLPVFSGLKMTPLDTTGAPATAAPAASDLPVFSGLKMEPVVQQSPDAALAATVQSLPEQGGMTPWRAATANPVEDMAANRALEMNRRFGTPLPVNQQHNEPETVAQAKAALSDPVGLGANALQGATLHGAGWLDPDIRNRAESYAGMHPTAGKLAEMGGAGALTGVTGGLSDLAAARLALSPLVRTLVRYAPSVGVGGGQGAVNTPEGASTGERLLNIGVGGLTGGAGQLGSDAAGNLFNRFETGRLPTYKPTVGPLVRGGLKTAAEFGGGALAHHYLPGEAQAALGSAAVPAAVMFPELRHALTSGPREIATGLKNLWSNVHGTFSTPKGPVRAARGRWAPGAYPPSRTAIPGAMIAPYTAGAMTPSMLARIYAEHHYDPNQSPEAPPF